MCTFDLDVYQLLLYMLGWKVTRRKGRPFFIERAHQMKYELKQIIPVIFMLYLDLPHSKRVQWLRVLKKRDG